MADQENKYPQGIKWTKQRKDVYDVLTASNEPLSAVDIYQKISKEKADASGNYAVSTIYRILAFFEEKNLVNKTNWMGDGTVVYELNRGSHTHYAICLECHKRIQLSGCPFAHVELEQENNDFTVTNHKLELYGFCKDCKKTKKI